MLKSPLNGNQHTLQHAAVCVGNLSKVYNPKASPWIALENATTEELKNQISKCPSGAISYYENK
jgi:uncharacterized Fe-S cluster protein YjdI